MRARIAEVAVVLAAVLAACAEPALPGDPEPEASDAPVEAEVLRPGREALLTELESLTATVVAARDRLVAAGEANDLAAARAAGDEAVALLIDDPELAQRSPSDLEPLFPSESVERGDAAAGGDRLTTTLTVAREAGDLGRRVADTLSEPIAGDLGAWQRDAAGMVELVRTTARPGAALEELERAVLELPGDGTRALAWALLTAEATSADAAAAYAERGIAHLDLVLTAIDALDVDPGGGSS